MNDELLRYQMRRLAAKIQECIFRQKVSEYGINAAEEEVWSRVDEIFSKAGVEIAESLRIIYAALLEWHKDPNKTDGIYEEMLKSVITKDQWRLCQACFDTPEKLRRFTIPNNVEDMRKDSYESAKKDILYQKLNDIITADVRVSEQEIESAYQEKYGHWDKKPTLEEVRDRLYNQLMNRKRKPKEVGGIGNIARQR